MSRHMGCFFFFYTTNLVVWRPCHFPDWPLWICSGLSLESWWEGSRPLLFFLNFGKGFGKWWTPHPPSETTHKEMTAELMCSSHLQVLWGARIQLTAFHPAPSKEAMPKWTTDGNFTLKVKGTWNQIKLGWLPLWCLVEKSSGGSSQKTNQWNWWIISNMLRN